MGGSKRILRRFCISQLGRHSYKQESLLQEGDVIKSYMAQQCFHSEYFDSLLHACKPCHLRCSNPPVPCQPYCNPSMTSSMKGIHIVLWTFLGLTLTVSLALFTLTFLLRKMNSEALKDKLQNPGSVLPDTANSDLMKSRDDGVRIFPRSLECTVEECTCEDCAESIPKLDSDHFPLPAMEEGATILVTTKTSDYGKNMPTASESVIGMEKPIHSRE